MGAALLRTYQQRVTDALKAQGLVPLSTGVTNPIPYGGSYPAAMAAMTGLVDKTQATFGSRTLDRYSASVGSSYRDQRYSLIKGFENVRLTSYQDTTGPAIGLGFNFDRPNARQVWTQAIGKAVSFDDARNGKVAITSGQARSLFDHDVLYAESVVSRAAGDRPLTQNQRLALVSVAYSAPARVASWSDTLQKGSDAQIMGLILHDSYAPNNPSVDALKSRRYAEASLYGNPGEAAAVMPAFPSFRDNVKVDPKTGQTTVRTFGTADAKDLNPEFRGRLQNLINSAPADIQSHLGIFSGYRSPEHQAQLYAQALKKYGSPEVARKWVAPPGRSEHDFGMAADLAYDGKQLSTAGGVPDSVIKWVHDNAGNYGLKFPLSNESWHIEPNETRSGVPMDKVSLQPISGLAPIPDDSAAVDPVTPMSRENLDNLRTPTSLVANAPAPLSDQDPLTQQFRDHFDGVPQAPGDHPEAVGDRAFDMRNANDAASGYTAPPDAYTANVYQRYLTPPSAYDSTAKAPAPRLDGTVPKSLVSSNTDTGSPTAPRPMDRPASRGTGIPYPMSPLGDTSDDSTDTRPGWAIASVSKAPPSVKPSSYGTATLTDMPRPIVNDAWSSQPNGGTVGAGISLPVKSLV